MSPSRAPGWYSDASDPSRQRWWDGGEWSHVTRQAPMPPQPAPPPPPQPYHQQPDQQQPYPGQQPYQQQPYPGQRPAPATPDGVPLADLMPRLLARFLDYLVTTTASVLLGLPFLLPVARDLEARVEAAGASGGTPDLFALVNESLAGTERELMLFQVVALLVSAAYTVTLIRWRGATLGKLAAGVRVRSWETEGLPSWRQSFARWLTREGVQAVPLVGLPYWVLDSFWPLWDQRRQGLHDKLPGTVVVRAR